MQQSSAHASLQKTEGGDLSESTSQAPSLQPSSLLMLLGVAGGGVAARRHRQVSCTALAEQEDSRSSDGDDVPDWLPRAALLMFALFCSTNFTFIKVLEENRSESAVQAIRFCAALLPFLPLLPKHSDKQSIVSGVEIGLWCALGYITQAVGLPHTEASKGAFLVSLTMLVVPVAKSLLGAKVPMQIWPAVVLAMGGTGLLLGVGDGADFSLGFGELMCCATALGFGLMFVRMDEYAKAPGFDTIGCTIWQVLTLAVSMTIWLLATTGFSDASQEVLSIITSGPDVLGILFWISIVTTAGVLYVETWAMEKIDSTEAGVIFASEPVWATIFASVMLGERFGVTEGLGGCLIVLACLLTQVKFETSKKTAGKINENTVAA